MKKRILLIALICTALFAVLFITTLSVSFGGVRYHTAVITLDGKEIRRVDLDTAPDEVFTVKNENGGTNMICIENGEIYVSEASCPDKICVKHGALKSELLPIICMPNKLVIELK